MKFSLAVVATMAASGMAAPTWSKGWTEKWGSKWGNSKDDGTSSWSPTELPSIETSN
jgi:hypothetical protein